MGALTEEAIRRGTQEIVFAMAPVPAAATDADLDLVDGLGYHSLALLELAYALEDEYELPPIDQESAQRIKRVSDVADYVVAQVREHAASGESA